MRGIFPHAADGGLPPNPATPNNPARAYPPQISPLSTAALYYGNGCDVRLRPEVVNSLISEVIATVDEAKLAYNPVSQENLELAVRYLIQRGLTVGAIAFGPPNDYTATLDPELYPTYNNFLVLCVVPEVTNTGAVRLNVNGRGLVPVVRNDGLNLQADDFRAGIPVLIGYQDGRFYMLSMVRSQIILPMTGDVNAWIRTDGSDISGDGTANSADKAFRTINGAWARLRSRYMPSMVFTLHLRFGIPGRYEAGQLGPYGGLLALHGNPAAPDQYRIMMGPTALFVGGGLGWNLGVSSVSNFFVEGVTFEFGLSDLAYYPMCLSLMHGTGASMSNCNFDASVSPGRGTFITLGYSSNLELMPGAIRFNGGGVSLDWGISSSAHSNFFSYIGGVSLVVNNMNFTQSFVRAQELSAASFACTISGTGTSGPRYTSSNLSIIQGYGNTMPGNLDGLVANGGLFVP